MSDDDLYFINKDSNKYKNEALIANERNKKIGSMEEIKKCFLQNIIDQKLFAMFLGFISFLDDESYMEVLHCIYKCKNSHSIQSLIQNVLEKRMNAEQIIDEMKKIL